MLYRIEHTTTYHYGEPVMIAHNEARLKPRTTPHQRVLETYLIILPDAAVRTEHLDYFGNPVNSFTVQTRMSQLCVLAKSVVDVLPQARVAPAETPAWEGVRARLEEERDRATLEAAQFRFPSVHVPPGRVYAEYAAPSFPPGRPVLEAVLDLTARIHAEFVFDPAATDIATPVQTVLEQRRGVCQDFAHLQIACLRAVGLAARYVSGYLMTVPPPGQERLVGADMSHAWLSVFCGDAGWVDVDPTNNLAVRDGHITVAWGRDYDDISPLKGIILGGGQQMVFVSVDVRPVDEAEWGGA